MNEIVQEKCVACRKDAPRVTKEEVEMLLPQVPDWEVVERGGISTLERMFRFENFAMAVEFTRKVAEIAEEEAHHPAILTEWGKVTVSWWTHKIRGLHRNDFIMAAKTDALATRQ
jgi:4a-hydroxytetrahydrobiopterin dehydratase